MKILVVSNLYPPVVLGGYEILCEAVTGSLIRSGHDVSVLTSDYRIPQKTGELPSIGRHGESIRRELRLFPPFDQPPRSARLKKLRLGVENEWITKQAIRRLRPDVVFFWSQRRLTLGALRAAESLDVPYAVTLNDDFLEAYTPPKLGLAPRNAARFALDRSLCRRNTYLGLRMPWITALSQSLVDEMLEKGAPVKDAHIIYQGVDPDFFTPTANPGHLHRPARLLYVGQVHEYKGVHTIIEALNLLSKQGVLAELNIIGEGTAEYRKRLETMIGQYGLGERVRLWGKVKRNNLPTIYRDHDLFVFSSIWKEPFGLTHLEAMSCAIPVISTTRGGPAEFLHHGENALTFEAEDAHELARHIRQVIEDGDLRRKLAEGGRHTVSQRFSERRYFEELESFLSDTVRRWPKKSWFHRLKRQGQ